MSRLRLEISHRPSWARPAVWVRNAELTPMQSSLACATSPSGTRRLHRSLESRGDMGSGTRADSAQARPRPHVRLRAAQWLWPADRKSRDALQAHAAARATRAVEIRCLSRTRAAS